VVSMFQFPIRNSVRSDQGGRGQDPSVRQCFNSPFGILFVRTTNSCAARPSKLMFQFPIRNSVRSDSLRGRDGVPLVACFNSPFGILFVRTAGVPDRFAVVIRDVSIPHSEFCSFGPDGAGGERPRHRGVSIPHSEFCSFGHK